MKCVVYNILTEDAKNIRQKVFIEEQGFQNEFDAIDDIAKHIVLYDEERAIGTCRFFWNNHERCYYIGRVAVMKEYRGRGLGERIITDAENIIKEMGGETIRLSGQVRVAPFYLKLGYQEQGEEYLDEGVPHIAFEKKYR